MQPSDFEQLERENGFEKYKNKPLHLYMICRRPRFTYDPDSFELQPDSVKGTFRIQIAGQVFRQPFQIPFRGFEMLPSLECPYPHTFMVLKSGNCGAAYKAAILAAKVPGMKDHLALDVLYVGQSYGDEGSRTAFDRLRSHATLQAIYAKSQAERPDQDIWLVLWNLKSQWLTVMDGVSTEFQMSETENDAHNSKLLRQDLADALEINLAEAALIRYFQPPFNVTFKKNFPRPEHNSYSECYEWDLNSLVVEVNMEDSGCMLRSASAPAKWHHTAVFSFHSEEERRSFLDMG